MPDEGRKQAYQAVRGRLSKEGWGKMALVMPQDLIKWVKHESIDADVWPSDFIAGILEDRKNGN